MAPCHFKKSLRQDAEEFNGVKLAGIFLVIILLTFNGCKEQTELPLTSLLKSKTDKMVVHPPTVVPSMRLEGAAQESEGTYSYQSEGRRDPFKSLVAGLKEKKPTGLTPLQQRSLGELKVIGIMWEAQGFTAMIATPDGKGFLIKKGTLVGPEGGVVQKITEDSIIVEEVYTDYYGKKKSKNTVLRLHAKEEGGG